MSIKKIKCPNCQKLTEYKPENSYRPFCSERCQLIDLGEWASEKYAVPIDNQTPDSETELKLDEDDNGEI
ncbi:MAG: DNA gyrase inhibitor YacG [Bdellovibrionales bacterium]|nr:DNA gyrase inhibitor YacG [Bdellovibrionales bacterium]